MSTYKVVWTDFALSELKKIHKYISDKAKSNVPADNVIARIFDKVDSLEHSPEAFQEEQFLKENGIKARYIVMGRYKIIYHLKDSTVYVTDVFNCSQHPSKMEKVR